MKKNIILMGGLAILFLFNACSTKIVELPPPEFKALLVKNSPFKGMRYNSKEPVLSRETSVTVTESSLPTEVVFNESYIELGKPKTVSYKVQLGEMGSNAVKLTIPRQTVDGKVYQGASIKAGLSEQGYYEIQSNSLPVNNLLYNMSIDGTIWYLDLKK
jgi:hypothetical protein